MLITVVKIITRAITIIMRTTATTTKITTV